MNQKNKTKLGKAALFGSALIWGSSFFIMKNTIANVPENFLLGTRFLAGALLLCIFFHKRLGKIDKSYLLVPDRRTVSHDARKECIFNGDLLCGSPFCHMDMAKEEDYKAKLPGRIDLHYGYWTDFNGWEP